MPKVEANWWYQRVQEMTAAACSTETEEPTAKGATQLVHWRCFQFWIFCQFLLSYKAISLAIPVFPTFSPVTTGSLSLRSFHVTPQVTFDGEDAPHSVALTVCLLWTRIFVSLFFPSLGFLALFLGSNTYRAEKLCIWRDSKGNGSTIFRKLEHKNSTNAIKKGEMYSRNTETTSLS